MKNNYPFILRILKGEEERFLETLSVGVKLYDEVKREVASRGDKVIPGDVVYRLYDTFGFPIDITNEMAQEDGLSLDTAGFEKAFNEQKERSRTDRRTKDLSMSAVENIPLNDAAETAIFPTRFTGYETLESDGKILAIVKDGGVIPELRQGDEGILFFDAAQPGGSSPLAFSARTV